MRLSAADRAKAITTMRAGNSALSSHRPKINPALDASGFIIDVRAVNPLNAPGSKKWDLIRRAKEQRTRTFAELSCGSLPPLPVRVTLTRYAPQLCDVGCGLNASLKHVRDGVADAMGVDDADPRIEWVYAQERKSQWSVGVAVVSQTLAGKDSA